jgi:hypothetical protein
VIRQECLLETQNCSDTPSIGVEELRRFLVKNQRHAYSCDGIGVAQEGLF